MTLSEAPPVVVFGTGALACAIGARLARAGEGAVTLVGSWEEGRRAIADPGALAVQRVRAAASDRSSMLQDLARGAITEIDALTGAVAAEGRRLGVPVPENETLWRQVREREGRPAPEA